MPDKCHQRLSQLSSAAWIADENARAVDGALAMDAGTRRGPLTGAQRDAIERLERAEDDLAGYRRDRYGAWLRREAVVALA